MPTNLLLIFLSVVMFSTPAFCQRKDGIGMFTLRDPSVLKQGDDVFIGTALMNEFSENVHEVHITDIKIRRAAAGNFPPLVLIDPEPPPRMWVGDIAPRNVKRFSSRWSATNFQPGEKYILIISGTYEDGDYSEKPFSAEREFIFLKQQSSLLNDTGALFLGTAHAAEAREVTPKLRELDAKVESTFDQATGLWSYSIVNSSKEFIGGLTMDLVAGARVEIVSSPPGWLGQISKAGRSVFWTIQSEDNKTLMVGPSATLGGFAIRSIDGSQQYATTPYALVSFGARDMVVTGTTRTPDKK